MSDFPRPKPQYDPAEEAKFRAQLNDTTQRAYRRGESVELWPGTAIFMRDETGTRWRMSVSTTGTTIWTAA